MFTGIIEALGRVQWMEDGVLVIECDQELGPDPVTEGESIAVNGCCLTVVAIRGNGLRFDLSPETLARTALGSAGKGSQVNVERAMRADGRFGGHMVQGHVDTAARVASITAAENSNVFRFQLEQGDGRYLVDKGSVTVDGISLTVVEPRDGLFDAWIIPHTLLKTNLGERRAGDRVNLEFDILAKYVERLLETQAEPGPSS